MCFSIKPFFNHNITTHLNQHKLSFLKSFEQLYNCSLFPLKIITINFIICTIIMLCGFGIIKLPLMFLKKLINSEKIQVINKALTNLQRNLSYCCMAI